MALNQEYADEQARYRALLQKRVQHNETRTAGLQAQAQPETYPIGQGPATADLQSSALPASRPAPTGQPPASNGAAAKAGGADPLLKDRGTPDQIVSKMGAGEVEAALERSANAVANGAMPQEGALEDPDLQAANVASKKDQVNQKLTASGANPHTALAQLRDQRLAEYERMYNEGVITKVSHTKLKDRWKNIFNIIPREDMGLVLMDFGFRAMMAGETMGDVAAIGAAGAGALQGVQQRQKETYDRKTSQFNMADEGARAELSEAVKGPDTISTEQGIYQWNPETRRYEAVKDPDSGETLTPSTIAGRAPVSAYEMREWMKHGLSEHEARLAAFSGVTPAQARKHAEELWQKEVDSASILLPASAGGNRISARGRTAEHKAAYIDDVMRGYGYGQGALQGGDVGQGGALPPEAAVGDERLTERPADMSDAEWDAYNNLMDEIEAGQ